jgi:hypothetical protein
LKVSKFAVQNCFGTVKGYQVLQYTTLEVVTGLMMVQGQLVTVKVVAYKLVSCVFQLEPAVCAAILELIATRSNSFRSSAYLGDGVGDTVVGQGGGLWAVGGV